MRLLFVVFLIFSMQLSYSQQSIGIGTTSPDSSAILDITSSEKGILIPRMSATHRQNIESPTMGLMVFDTTTNAFYYYSGLGWFELIAGNIKVLEDDDGDTKVEVEKNADDDVIRFNVDGKQAMWINPNGVVNINGKTETKLVLKKDSTNFTSNLTFLGSGTTYNLGTPSMDRFRIWSSGYGETFSIRPNGHIGIHNFNPDTTLHIVGSLKIEDGNEQDGYVLTSDSEGLATWQLTSNPNHSLIEDVDMDTKIQLEESNDEDVIRFDISGTEIITFKKDSIGNTLIGDLANDLDGNTLIGSNAGINLDPAAKFNVLLGQGTGRDITTGSKNTFLGRNSGTLVTDGTSNTYVGNSAGRENVSGNGNTFLGDYAGRASSGSNNVFLGSNSGEFSQGSDKLFIENSDGDSTQALIYGEFDNDLFRVNGNTFLSGGGRDLLTLKTESNADDFGIAYMDENSLYSWNIFRETISESLSDLIIAGGVYKTNIIGLSERMRITSDGLVGIGVSSPNVKLHVNGAIKVNQIIQAGNPEGLEFRTNDSVIRLKVRSSGKVEIGTDGSAITNIVKRSEFVNLPSIAANSDYDLLVDMPEANTASSVIVSPDIPLPDGLVISYAQAAFGTHVRINIRNTTDSDLDPPSTTYYITVINF